MKFTEQDMNCVLEEMLAQGEKNLCPVYCVFKQTGFFASPSNIIVGYASCTSYGRLLSAKNFLGWTKAAYPVSEAVRLKIKKNIFGQYSVYAEFPDGKKKAKLKFMVSPKVVGCNLPNQRENTEELIDILTKYER